MTPARTLSSKQFLIDRIVNQARLEDIPLADVEIRMLGFAEVSASPKDMQASQAFERDFDDEGYEAKIAGLIRHAYDQDRRAGKEEEWNNALARLASGDMYLNVLIDRAGIEDSGPAALFSDWRFIVYGLLPCGLALVAAVMIGLSPFGARLIRNDALRVFIATLLIASPFALQHMSWSKLWNTRKRRRHSHPD
ncbi:hypothetical protein P8935_02880 [Telmatobacter sp. DSM 110680]|uniref:Uncharacterized protein n=1 Tax=Telmatobacter sp. DSM 110680 TaxID=3036704 RepID=A0AAU7DKV4_9BACT